MGFAEIFLEHEVAFADHDQTAVLRVRTFGRVVGLFEAVEVDASEGASFGLILWRAPAALGVRGREVFRRTEGDAEKAEAETRTHGCEKGEGGFTNGPEVLE